MVACSGQSYRAQYSSAPCQRLWACLLMQGSLGGTVSQSMFGASVSADQGTCMWPPTGDSFTGYSFQVGASLDSHALPRRMSTPYLPVDLLVQSLMLALLLALTILLEMGVNQ